MIDISLIFMFQCNETLLIDCGIYGIEKTEPKEKSNTILTIIVAIVIIVVIILTIIAIVVVIRKRRHKVVEQNTLFEKYDKTIGNPSNTTNKTSDKD